jgi:hypothetical protein
VQLVEITAKGSHNREPRMNSAGLLRGVAAVEGLGLLPLNDRGLAVGILLSDDFVEWPAE